MRLVVTFLLFGLLATPALAQDQPGFFGRLFGTDDAASDEDQGGLLETLIEDNLSSEGRDVSITGFEGALSGRATLDTLTISDRDGAWLTLTDVVLDWNRGALFRGRLEVTELSASEILLPRTPLPAEDETAPTPEASGFSLPELPVSVAIDRINARRVLIGQPVFGLETEVSVDGNLRLESGEGAASLALQKLNAPGAINLDTAFANSTEVLALNLAVDEGPNGIIANLLDLPGRPSVSLGITGNAPLSEFAADIRLATDGAERLTGRISTSRPDEGSLRTQMALQGDIAPIFNPEYQPFFGNDVSLSTTVTTFPDGRVSIQNLSVEAASLDIDGTVLIGTDGLPDRIEIDGAIASSTGPVLLPVPGEETRVSRVDLDVDFDADEGDRWTGSFLISDLERRGFSAERLRLSGSGQIVAEGQASVTAALDFAAEALDLGNPDAEEALGEVVEGRATVAWTAGGPLRLSDLVIDGESYGMLGSADLSFTDEGPFVEGRLETVAEELSVFSGLAGRRLGGRIGLTTEFAAAPLAGTFDVSAEGTSENLLVSQPQADRLLEGSAILDLSARRDETGIAITLRRLESPNANLSGAVRLQSGGSNAVIAGQIADSSILLPGVEGPIRLNASADEDDNRVWMWRAETALEGASLSAEGTVLDLYGTPVVTATGTAEAEDLAQFSALAQRTIGGRIDTTFAGELVSDLTRFSGNLSGTATNLKTGIAEADALLEGEVSLNIDAVKAGDIITLRNSSVFGPFVEVVANGTLVSEAGRFAAEGRFADASRIFSGAPSEALEFAASGQQDGRDWALRGSAAGAGLSVGIEGVALDAMGETAAFDGILRGSADDLSVLSDLANRPLSGRLSLDAEGEVSLDLATFDLIASVEGANVSVGQPQADELLAGPLSLRLNARRNGGSIAIETLGFSTDQLDVDASGALASDGSEVELTASLANVAPFAPGFSGPATVSGTVGQNADGQYLLDLDGVGPGGTRVSAEGSIVETLDNVALGIDGQLPLGFANAFIAPRALSGMAGFQLRVDGTPSLESVSGRITASGARLIAPALGFVLNDISLNAALTDSRVQLSLNGAVEAGGTVSIEGPVSLNPPFDAALGVTLNGVVLRDPRLYETSVTGRLDIDGAMGGGARIAGTLDLGETNIRIPSSGLGGAGDVPEILHLNEPPPVRGTRRRAGVLDTGSEGEQTSGPRYPLDISIQAPSRIFIRGRGLDSEFGGSLRITGDTADVVPIGAFNLIRGRLDILGQRLTLEEATATIQGSFLPVVRIRATTRTDEYTISVIVAGPVSDPEITFSSSPDLPQEEVLSRLIFGRGLDTLSPIQAARLALAVRTLAGRGGEGVVGNIREGAGLADFDVTTDASGNAAVRAGAYLGENVYTDVTVGASGDTELNLNLDVSPSVTLKGSVTNDGSSSVGIFFERDY